MHIVIPASARTPVGEVSIRFAGVKKRFGSKVVFDGLDLEVRRGETLTVLGGSGSGKSVMLKMLIGLLPVDEGSIVFDGIELTRLEETDYGKIRRRIGMLFQNGALFDSLTVADNVAYGLREHHFQDMTPEEIRRRVARALELVSLPGVEPMMPADLSGGMKKRVALARCIAVQPEVVLYDEPTTGLDPVNAARIAQLVRAISSALHVTSIVVTHDMATAFTVSDRMAMVHQGRILMHGPPAIFRDATDPCVRDFIGGTAGEPGDVAALLAGGM
jgi:phospholipid/cholesterol/gamma-HCH transport system ATP-binding protein